MRCFEICKIEAVDWTDPSYNLNNGNQTSCKYNKLTNSAGHNSLAQKTW